MSYVICHMSKGPKSTELSNKRRKEKCLKVNINGIMDDIVDFMQSSDNVVEVKNSPQELNKQRKMHESLSHEIIDLIGDEEVDDECQQYSEYHRKIRNAMNKAQRFITELSNTVDTESVNSFEKNHKEIKLPKFDLPVFSGNILKFTAYWDQFKCVVHDDRDLSAAQKLSYLRTSLKSTAL